VVALQHVHVRLGDLQVERVLVADGPVPVEVDEHGVAVSGVDQPGARRDGTAVGDHHHERLGA